MPVPRLSVYLWEMATPSLDLHSSIPPIPDCFKEDMLSSMNVSMRYYLTLP